MLNSTAIARIASTIAAAYAPARLKLSNWVLTKSGSVWVLPLMFPATTLTAPNSPSARAVASTTP